MDAVTLVLLNVMCYSKYTVPPKLSGQGLTVVFSVRIKPVIVMLFVVVGAPLVVLMGCSWAPWGAVWLVAVSTVLIGVTDVVAMLGTVVSYSKPFMSMTVSLHDSLVGCGCVRVAACNSTTCKSLFHFLFLLLPKLSFFFMVGSFYLSDSFIFGSFFHPGPKGLGLIIWCDGTCSCGSFMYIRGWSIRRFFLW